MARKLHRVGLFAAEHKWTVLGAWLALIAALIVLASTFGGETANNLELPGTDSQAATDLLAKQFPPQQNGSNPIVFHAQKGKVTDSANESAIKSAHKAIKKVGEVATATSPFAKKGAGQISDDKQTTFIPVLLDVSNQDLTDDIASEVLDAAAPAKHTGMQVAAGGSIGSQLSKPKTESSEVIGLTAAMIILALTFGTLVAAGMPILSAVTGLIAGLLLISLLASLVQVPEVGPTLATMIGLGVGIDYALFLVSRYRDERARGIPQNEAIAAATATSGTAIAFAGTTVVIALATLFVAGIPLVTTLGYTSAFAVITAVVVAITLLPALLALAGPRIDSLRLPRFLHPDPDPDRQGFWDRWAELVTTHPWRSVAIGLLILLPLMVPVSSLQLGQEDVGATPKSTTERQAYDLMSGGFGPGYNGPLIVAVDLGSPAKESKEVKQQEQQAKRLQSKLETEQQQGQSDEARLTSQADALQAQQAALEAQQAALEAEAGSLDAQRSQLETSRRQLARERTLKAQLAALLADAKPIARKSAKLAAQEAELRGRLGALSAIERQIKAKLTGVEDPRRRQRLRRRLSAVRSREATLKDDLARVTERRRANEARAREVADQAARIRVEAESLGDQAASLASQAASLAMQAASLEQSKDELEESASDAQVQAANLNTQKAELQAEQQQAKQQQKKAEDLQKQLTRELTKAGGDKRGTDPRLVDLQKGLTNTVGVKAVSPPQVNDPGTAAVFTAIPTTRPAATATADLVRTIRTYVIPQSTAGMDVDAHVGGQTASYVDLAAGISAKLMLVIAAVVALGFVVLTMAFRSVLVSTQAAIANVLSVTAAFGVVTLCFQEGWGLTLVGVDTSSGTDPIASFVPLIMFAVLFGLSTDYQVFLMSKIEQHRAQAQSDREAIAQGLAAGGRVIAAAALIMISVFASFILNGDPTVKQFGVGLSVGVGLAAMTVLLLAPALLVLAGRGGWWVPAWADRVLPRVDIEGEHASPRPE